MKPKSSLLPFGKRKECYKVINLYYIELTIYYSAFAFFW